MSPAGLGATVVDGEDCAVGGEELLHAATITMSARTMPLTSATTRSLDASYGFGRGIQVRLADARPTLLPHKAGCSAHGS